MPDEKPGGRGGVDVGCETGQDVVDGRSGAALKEELGCIGEEFQEVEFAKLLEVLVGGSGWKDRL